MDKEWGAVQRVAGILPLRLRREVLERPEGELTRIEEVRLRLGQPMSLVLPEGEVFLDLEPVTAQELDQLLELASRSSVHAVMDQLRQGYLTLEGGHRVGLCGTVALRNGEIHSLRRPSSASIRLARQVPGACRELLPQLCPGGRFQSALVLAPPGLGKTTLLRDLIRAVSSGEGCQGLRVGLADERGEVAALREGLAQLAVGPRTDVVEGCSKSQGLLLLLRAMNPQVLAVDEITAPEDVDALVQAAGCGAELLATAHGGSVEDLSRRPVYRRLLSEKIFHHLVTIRRINGIRRYTVEEIP